MGADNDMNTQQMLLEMAIKQGTATVLAGLLLWAFWAVVIEPGANERRRYSETITTTSKENAKAVREQVTILREMKDTNHSIQETTQKQSDTLDSIKNEVQGQTALRSQAMETMSAFATEMREVNPANSLKLDVLLKQAEERQDGIKLDIIIEKIEALQEPEPEQ